jgi:hypothetical protein
MNIHCPVTETTCSKTAKQMLSKNTKPEMKASPLTGGRQDQAIHCQFAVAMPQQH